MASTYRSVRRADAAAATREAIVAAARDLFLGRGYQAVTVADIARRARVAAPTVYSSAGGKAEILRLLIEPAVHTPFVGETLDAISGAESGEAVIRTTVEGVRRAHEQHWEVLSVLLPQCRAEPSAAAVLDAANASFLAVIAQIAARLTHIGALRSGVDHKRAVDVLWFHLAFSAWSTLVTDRGWTFDDAQEWTAESLVRALC